MSQLSRRVKVFLRRATDESIRADVIGALFLLGALLSVFSLLFPHPDRGEVVVWSVIAGATIVGAALIWRSTRWPTAAIHLAVGLGSVCINTLMLASGVASGVYAVMFCWVVLVSVNFFSPRAAVLHFIWMSASFALVLALVESSGGYSQITRWVTATLALAVTGGATAWLVYRRRLAEAATQRFLDLAEEMLCTIGPGDRLARVNRAWERTLGYPAHSLYSQSVLDLIHPAERAEMERGLGELRRGESCLSIDTHLRRGDGSYVRMHWSASYSAEEGLVYARIRPRRAAEASAAVAEAV